MPEAGKGRDKLGRFPTNGCVLAKEIFPHVVVNADNIKTLRMEKLNSLATD
jgi:hypothetical protein